MCNCEISYMPDGMPHIKIKEYADTVICSIKSPEDLFILIGLIVMYVKLEDNVWKISIEVYDDDLRDWCDQNMPFPRNQPGIITMKHIKAYVNHVLGDIDGQK